MFHLCTKSIGACQVHNCERSAHNCVLDTLHFYAESKARERREFREVKSGIKEGICILRSISAGKKRFEGSDAEILSMIQGEPGG